MTQRFRRGATQGCVSLALMAAFPMSLYAAESVATQPAVQNAIPQEALTQDAPSATPISHRPKICLVLSGGGARGAAHVGVLKVLEEYRVPIDCIVGTSMGSLVGAAYATGMTMPEMDKIIGRISTQLLFKELPPRQQLTMRRKQDDATILFTPEVGLSKGEIKFGKGIVSGVQLETVLRQLTKVKGYYRFDRLPIPYRAVATDLVTGKAVVFDQGDIARVMRASMAVPGAVAPAEFDGMILADGMLTGNLPIETARAMGADIIIAVNVGTPLLKREEISGILGVSGQMLSILTEQNVQTSLAELKANDILISPELGEYSTSDFDSLPSIVPLGETAARKVADRLAALSLSPDEYAALRAHQQITVTPDTRPIDEIRFVNLQRVNPEALRKYLKTETGKPLDENTLDRDMRRLYGTGDFEHVNYHLLDEGDRRVLAIEAIEKSWGPDYLRFGLGLSSDFTGDAFFNLLASYRQTWLNSLGAEWRNDFQIGRTSSVATEFYQPLDTYNYFFVAPHAGIERRSTTLYDGENRVARYDISSMSGGIDLGSQFSRYGELRLGAVSGLLKPELDTGAESLSPGEPRIDQGAYVMRLMFDQFDSVNFPRSGWRGSAHMYDSNADLGADETYKKWDMDAATAVSFGEHTLNFAMKVGNRIGDDRLPSYDQFQWGGFLQQSGYATGQLLGQSLKYGRMMYYHRIMRGTFMDGAYGGVMLESSKIEEPLIESNDYGVLRSAGVFIGSDTPLGPAYIAYGHAEDGNDAFYFYLGKPY